MLKISLCCVAGIILVPIALAIVSVPLAIITSLLPWLLKLAGVVLLVKAVLDKPMRWENFTPAIGAFVLSFILGWIF